MYSHLCLAMYLSKGSWELSTDWTSITPWMFKVSFARHLYYFPRTSGTIQAFLFSKYLSLLLFRQLTKLIVHHFLVNKIWDEFVKERVWESGSPHSRSYSPWILAHLAVDKNCLAYALQYRRHQGQILEGGIICTRYHAVRSVQDVVLESPFLGDGWTGDRATGWITVFQFAPDTLISLDTTAPLIKIIPFLA